MDQENSNNNSNKKSSVKKNDLTRKKRKPLMEKRRRARINASLEQLKKLVLDATRRDGARYTKLEKADILELTVRHLQDMQRSNMNFAVPRDMSIISKGSGFEECAAEVGRYLSTNDRIPKDVRNRLMGHLSNCKETTSKHISATTPIDNRVAVRMQRHSREIVPPVTHKSVPMLQNSPMMLNPQRIPMFHGALQQPSVHSPAAHMLSMMPMGGIHIMPEHSGSQLKHSPPSSALPHTMHEHIFHSQFSTSISNISDSRRHFLENEANINCVESRINISEISNNALKLKRQITGSNDKVSLDRIRYQAHLNETDRRHGNCMDSIHMLSSDNVWRPW